MDNAGHVVIQAPPPVLTGAPNGAVVGQASPPPENSHIFSTEYSANTFLSQVKINEMLVSRNTWFFVFFNAIFRPHTRNGLNTIPTPVNPVGNLTH